MSQNDEPRPKRFPARLPVAAAAARVATPTTVLRPQRVWSSSLRDQTRALDLPPVGLGMEAPRFRQNLIALLQADGCDDAAVLAAMAAVPRHVFVDAGLAAQAYQDTALPIGLGQTISKPTVVARMLGLLRMRPGGPRALGRVLEIGTGCGYQAALLEHLARHVYSVERLKPLFDKAQANLAELRGDRLRLVYGDGRLGHAPNAPYDGIIAAAGGDDLPPAWIEQLAPGGRLVAPCAQAPGAVQRLVVIDRLGDGSIRRHELEAVRFVPLQSGVNDPGRC